MADLATYLSQTDPATITTLPNQLRVVTGNTPGHFSSVGVYIDAGSRYESSRTSGASHVLDRMAFKVGDRTVSPYTYIKLTWGLLNSPPKPGMP